MNKLQIFNSEEFGEEKTKQMIFKAVNAGMGADK